MPNRKRATRKLAIPAEWTFRTPEVARAFDDHVREQLPWYEIATGAVVHVARAFIPSGGVIVDVGASTGNIGRALAPVITSRNALFLPFDSARSMAEIYDGPGTLCIADAVEYDFAKAQPDVVICFLSLMFIPTKYRAIVLNRIRSAIRPGGALIVVDKMEPNGGYVGTVNYRLTLAAKYEAGASAEDVLSKELSITGIQRPLAYEEVETFVEFFRFGDFAGFVWEKVSA